MPDLVAVYIDRAQYRNGFADIDAVLPGIAVQGKSMARCHGIGKYLA